MILRCNCEHKFQDERYGWHMRVHNPCSEKGPKSGQACCTVCGKYRYINSATAATTKKKAPKKKGRKG